MKIEELDRAIGKLEGTVETGFREVNRRLDKMNGSNLRRDIEIDDLKRSRDIIAGKITVIGTICGFIGAAVIACFKFFTK